jgi:hypothetical protein
MAKRPINTIESSTEALNEEQRQQRIHNEVVRIANPEEEAEADEEEIDEGHDKAPQEEAPLQAAEAEAPQKSKSLWRHITTGGFLASSGAQQYYRYMMVIAAMCFISIVITFMSLNYDHEYRRKERLVGVLRERAVLKNEERHRIAAKDEVVRRLKEEFGIEMIDLSQDSRRITK